MKKLIATIITFIILSQSLMLQSTAADNSLNGEVQTTYGQHITYESESKLLEIGELVFTESFEDCEDIYDFDPEEILESAELYEQERKLLKLNSKNDTATQNAVSSPNHPYHNKYPIPNSMFTTVSNGVESYPMSVAEYGFRGRYFRFSGNYLGSIVTSLLILMYDVVPSATVYNNNTKKYEISLSLTIFVLFDTRIAYNISSGNYTENDLLCVLTPQVRYNDPQINIGRNGTKNEIIMYQKSQDAYAHKFVQNSTKTVNATFVSNVLIALLDNVTLGLTGVMIEALDLNWSGFNSAYILGNITPLPYYKESQLIYLSGKLAGGVNQKLDGHLYKYGDFFRSTVWFNCPSYLVHTDTGWVITFSASY